MIRIEHADMLEAIPRLVAEGVVCDACCCDPPYHLTATQKRFGAANSAPAQHGRDGAMSRLSGGFMGQRWDGGDIAFRPETWATVATILRPGAFLVAFGGTRTHHRLACAIEDAGFVIQDTIAWLFATGFPKRRDMLKPAFEPIVLAYKPGGARTMQIDECRIGCDGGEGWNGNLRRKPMEGDERVGVALGMFAPSNGRTGESSAERRYTAEGSSDFAAMPGPRGGSPMGRWPANVCHDGSDEVIAAFPQSAGQLFTRPTSPKKSNGIYGDWADQEECVPRGDTGSAARFFFSAKAGAEDRWGSRHPTVKPVDLIAWLVALVTPPGGTFIDPFAGSGTAAIAALKTGRDAILIEREDAYIADIRERIAYYEGQGRHSLASKARRTPDKPIGGLFAQVLAE